MRGEGHVTPPTHREMGRRRAGRGLVAQRRAAPRKPFPRGPLQQRRLHGVNAVTWGAGSLGKDHHPVAPRDRGPDLVHDPHRVPPQPPVHEDSAHLAGQVTQDRPLLQLLLGHEHTVQSAEQQHDVHVAQVVGHQDEGGLRERTGDADAHPRDPGQSPGPERHHAPPPPERQARREREDPEPREQGDQPARGPGGDERQPEERTERPRLDQGAQLAFQVAAEDLLPDLGSGIGHRKKVR